jgi:hypothetical protein
MAGARAAPSTRRSADCRSAQRAPRLARTEPCVPARVPRSIAGKQETAAAWWIALWRDGHPHRESTEVTEAEQKTASVDRSSYLTLAFAFRRSAQYFFIRVESAFRAAADIWRPRLRAAFRERVTARRRLGNANSGNVRSIAMMSARSSFSIVCAPARANSRSRLALSAVDGRGTCPPCKSLGL